MKKFTPLLVLILLLTFVLVATAQDSPVPSPTPEPTLAPTVAPDPTLAPTVTPEPPPGPEPLPDPDDIVSDIIALVDLAGLGGLASLLITLLAYFNIVPDGWGGRVYFGLGVFVFAVSLALSADEAEYTFSVLREFASLISLLLGGVGLNAGLRYMKMLPGRRGA